MTPETIDEQKVDIGEGEVNMHCGLSVFLGMQQQFKSLLRDPGFYSHCDVKDHNEALQNEFDTKLVQAIRIAI